ncbi:MAG TPA: secretin N-terminal domain-containing protein [Syntrophorhabdaceae bacterium]|nr:secretin N-terminal domain-containing protein [Syntrophorhabdaceae bacterium]
MKRTVAFLCFFLVSGWLFSYADSVPTEQVVSRQTTKGARTEEKTLPGESQAVKKADEPQKQERNEIKNGSRPKPSSPERKRAPRAGGPVSLNFDDADAYQVIQTIFGEILRVNYVVDQRVKGRVTFRSVTPVAADRVLAVMEVILRLNGMGVVEESGLYRIVPISDVSREPAEVTLGRDPDSIVIEGKSIIQVVPVMYSQSAEVIKLIAPFITTSAVVVEVPNINHIIIVDTDANVKRLLKLISLFDSERTKQKRPQIFVYHVQNNKARDIASILQQVFITSGHGGTATPSIAAPSSPGRKTTAPKQAPAPVARTAAVENTGGMSTAGGSLTRDAIISPSTKIIAEENLNSIIVLATPEDYEVIKEAIERIDIIPRQVVIEGVIAEITLKDDLKLGVSWALQFKPGGMNGVLSAVDGTVGFNMPGATPTSTTGSGTFTFAGTVGNDFKAVIDMLATQSKAKLLAVPHVLVSDNKEARIQVGEQVPIVTSETFASTTVSPQRTIQYKDIGIILKVKPRINEGGLVSLELAQEVSSYDTIKLFDGEDNIIVKKTETTTNLVVQDGQTILIGGLIREDVSSARSGIPYLSKIPLLGYLFGNTTDENHRKELIILLTPRVIKSRKDAQKTTSNYIDDITRTGKGKLKKEELIRSIGSAGKDKKGQAGGNKMDEVAKDAGPNGQVRVKDSSHKKNAQTAKGHEITHSEIFEDP